MTPSVMVDRGLAKEEEIIDLGKVIAGETSGRRGEDDVIVYFARGMAIYDVMCGYRVYENALSNGVGEKLSLWQSAFWS